MQNLVAVKYNSYVRSVLYKSNQIKDREIDSKTNEKKFKELF